MGNESRTDTCLPTEVKWCLVAFVTNRKIGLALSIAFHTEQTLSHTSNQYGKTLPQNKHQGACLIIKKTNFPRKGTPQRVAYIRYCFGVCQSLDRVH